MPSQTSIVAAEVASDDEVALFGIGLVPISLYFCNLEMKAGRALQASACDG